MRKVKGKNCCSDSLKRRGRRAESLLVLKLEVEVNHSKVHKPGTHKSREA